MATLVKTSAPNHFVDIPEDSDPDLVLDSNLPPPVTVGMVPMTELNQTAAPAAPAAILDDEEDEEILPQAEEETAGSGYAMAYPALPNAVTIIPVGAGLAAENGLVTDDLPVYMEEGVLPEVEINNAFDDSVPALLVPVEDIVVGEGGSLALIKRGGAIRAFGYRTGDGDIIYGDGLGSLFGKILKGAKNVVKKVGNKVVQAGKKVVRKVGQVGKKVIQKGAQVGKKVLQSGVNLAKKGVTIIKNAAPQILGNAAQAAAATAMDHISNGMQGDEEEEVIYVDEDGNELHGEGLWGGAIYARGLYGSAILARGYYGGFMPPPPDPDAPPPTDDDDEKDDDGKGERQPEVPQDPRASSSSDHPDVNATPTGRRRQAPTRKPNSAEGAAGVNNGRRIPMRIRQPRRQVRWSPFARDAVNAVRHAVRNVRRNIHVPPGFQFPDDSLIKRFIYIGIVILSAVLSFMATKASYNNYRYYQTHPWEQKYVQTSMRKYLGPKYKYDDAGYLTRPDQYVIFPGDYNKKPRDQRWLKRRDLNHLLNIEYRQAKKDSPWRTTFGLANARSITNYPRIPGVDNYDDLYAMEGPSFNSFKRGLYYYTPYYDRTSNPPPNAPPPPPPPTTLPPNAVARIPLDGEDDYGTTPNLNLNEKNKYLGYK